MTKPRSWWVAALATVIVLGAGLLVCNAYLRIYAYYDNGETRRGTAAAINRLIADAASDPRTKLGQGWEQSPGYAARFFTMNLLGIDQLHDDWTQTAAGPGNVVRQGDRVVGVYAGPLSPDTESRSAKVFLSLDSGKSYRIDLSRPWKGGPWLVVQVSETGQVNQTGEASETGAGKSPSGPASLRLQPMSQMFPEGETGRWLLPDGTILVEGPSGRLRQYGRYYPQYDGAAEVIIKDYDPMLLEITDDKLCFLTLSYPSDGSYAFPSIVDYDLKDSLLVSSELAHLPVTQGTRLGLDLPGAARGATIEAIRLNGDSVEIKYKAFPPSVGPLFEIRSDPDQKRLVIEVSDVPGVKGMVLPFSISGKGLVQSVRVEAGTSRGADRGLTVLVSLDPQKWARLTYTETWPAEADAPALILTFSDAQPPTDLTPKVVQRQADGANSDSADSDGADSDWTAQMGISQEWIQARWTLPNGNVLVEINGGGKTDNANMYAIENPRTGQGDLVVGIATESKFLAVSGDTITFVCSTVDFKPSFDYLLAYDLATKTTKIEPVYHGVESAITFGGPEEPPLRSVSVANDVVSFRFDPGPGGDFVCPKTAIKSDAASHTLSVEMFGVKPANALDAMLSWGEGCRLISTILMVDGAGGKPGVTVNLRLNPDLWDKAVYAMTAGDLENHLVLTDTVAPTDLDGYSSSDH